MAVDCLRQTNEHGPLEPEPCSFCGADAHPENLWGDSIACPECDARFCSELAYRTRRGNDVELWDGETNDPEESFARFWAPIVLNPDQSLNLDQVKLELHDYLVFMQTAAKVYYHVTDGRISKINTTAEAIIAQADDCFERLWREREEEGGDE